MLWKTHDAFRDRLDYRNADGLWIAEFSGRLHIRVEDASLEGCRRRALDVLDEQLAAWIAGVEPTSPEDKHVGTTGADSSGSRSSSTRRSSRSRRAGRS